MPKITNELMKTFPGKVLSMHMFATSFTPKVIILLCSIVEAYLGANTNLRNLSPTLVVANRCQQVPNEFRH